MPGRRPKPLKLHISGGNKRHLTKEEIESREAAEIRIGERVFICPEVVKKDAPAFQRWQQLEKHLNSEETEGLITDIDTAFIARYCLTYSEYVHLKARREALNNYDGMEPEEILGAHHLLSELGYTEKTIRDLFRKIDFIYSTGGLLNLESAINKKMEQLIKFEDRLFLNPLARIRTAAPGKKKEKEDPLQCAGFGNI